VLIFTGTGQHEKRNCIFAVQAHNEADAEDLARRHGIKDAEVKPAPDFPMTATETLMSHPRQVFIATGEKTEGNIKAITIPRPTPEEIKKRDAEIVKARGGRR
jgi:hypothetical protein